MQHYWKTYSVPITISAVGLLLAIVLGVAPLIGQGRNSQSADKAIGQIVDLNGTIEDLRVAQSAEIDALRQMITAQSTQISDLQNRNSNLDRAVTRTFQRARKNNEAVASLSDTNQRLSNLETQMDTLNSAVPRMSARIRALQSIAN